MIRNAEVKDIPQVLDIVHEFYDESKFAKYFNVGWDDKDMFIFLRDLIMSEDGAFMLAEKDGKAIGFVFGAVREWYAKKDDLIAVEFGWYVCPEHRGGITGKELLVAFENWGIDKGANSVESGTVVPVKPRMVGRLLGTLGYKQYNHVYVKHIGDNHGRS